MYSFRQILLNDWMDWTQISIGATVPQPLKRFSSNFQYIKHYYEVIGCLSVCLFICLRPISSDLAIFLLVPFCSGEGFVQKNYGSGIWFLHKSGLINFPPFFQFFSIWNDYTNIFEFTSEKSGKPKETKMISSSPIATLATRGYGRSH